MKIRVNVYNKNNIERKSNVIILVFYKHEDYSYLVMTDVKTRGGLHSWKINQYHRKNY
jgi:hypothetical protein